MDEEVVLRRHLHERDGDVRDMSVRAGIVPVGLTVLVPDPGSKRVVRLVPHHKGGDNIVRFANGFGPGRMKGEV